MKGDSKTIEAWKTSGAFCLINYNDPVCLRIRDLLLKLTDYYGKRKTYRKNNVIVDPLWYADENYFTVLDQKEHYMWVITWYKDRGQTDMILFQGNPAWCSEAETLLKLLRKEAKK